MICHREAYLLLYTGQLIAFVIHQLILRNEQERM